MCGELRTTKPLNYSYHISCEDEYFSREGENVYRNNKILRLIIDKRTGNEISKDVIKTNHAKVMYDTSNLDIRAEVKN